MKNVIYYVKLHQNFVKKLLSCIELINLCKKNTIYDTNIRFSRNILQSNVKLHFTLRCKFIYLQINNNLKPENE